MGSLKNRCGTMVVGAFTTAKNAKNFLRHQGFSNQIFEEMPTW